MGWLYRRDPITNPVAYLTTLYDRDGDQTTNKVLAAARGGNTVYLALKSTDKGTGRSFVTAIVILISNTRQHGFGYKDMDESMGPHQCACPNRLMRLLSPVADLPHPGYAAEWRARVAAHHNAAAALRTKRASLRPGSIVTLDREVSFRDGTTAAAFRLCFVRGKMPIFEPVDRPGHWCRLPPASLVAAVITPADATAGPQAAGTG
jgi:hypothetical protein